MSDDRHDRVSRRAYELWQQEGGGHGRHEDHWHRAAAELAGQANDSPAARDAATDDASLTVPADMLTGTAAPADAEPARKRAAAKPSSRSPAKPTPKPRAKSPKAK